MKKRLAMVLACRAFSLSYRSLCGGCMKLLMPEQRQRSCGEARAECSMRSATSNEAEPVLWREVPEAAAKRVVISLSTSCLRLSRDTWRPVSTSLAARRQAAQRHLPDHGEKAEHRSVKYAMSLAVHARIDNTASRSTLATTGKARMHG